jgi:hypothetical protein
MRRVALLLNFFALFGMFLFGSQIWASATLSESFVRVEISGLEAFPQLSVILVAWLLIVFVSRYVVSLFGRFMLSAVLFLLFSTAAPVWFESASGSLKALGPKIAAITGIGDWKAQSDLLKDGSFAHIYADLFVILLIISFAVTLLLVWSDSGSRARAALSTRIDRLPKW